MAAANDAIHPFADQIDVEGVDCVIRGGHLPDSEMICRPLAMLQEITCASPA
jgi:DNA-binding transcriptional LysR family regulator